MSAWTKIAGWAATGCLSVALAGSAAIAAEITVVSTAGPMPEVMGALVPMFEQASGHKVAIKPHAVGEAVRRYGQIIGFAKTPIAP